MRELTAYSPKRADGMILIELRGQQSELLALLRAVEACLSGNDIRTVCVEIDGQTYMMEPRSDERPLMRPMDR
jgi:hypothetical protein